MKILFVTSKSLSKTSGGSILFNSLFERIRIKNFSCFICDDYHNFSSVLKRFDKVFYNYSILFSNHFINTIIRKNSFFSYIFFFLKYKVYSKYVFFKFKNSISGHDKIWIYISQQSIPLAALIHKNLKIKMHLSIQDNFSTHLKKSEFIFLKNDFEYLLNNAHSIDFISEYSKEYFNKKYNLSAKSISFLISQTFEVGKPKLSDSIKFIGFSGNVWCGETIKSFLKGIKIFNSFNSNVKLKVVFFSSLNKDSSFFHGFHDCIEIKSFVSYKFLINELQKCDLLYIPMLFSKEFSDVNITSFPSKIVTYLNCKIPILNHSPKEASTHDFISKYNLGISINSLDPFEIYQILDKKLIELNLCKRMEISSNMDNVINIFDKDTNVKRLENLLFYE